VRDQEFEALIMALKRAAAALREADVPFLLGGGLACWARVGPESDHDLDLMLREEHAARALEVLTELGMRPEKPPEGWLYKVWDGDVLIDLIFRPASGAVDEEMFARADELEVAAVPMHVMALEDVMVTKLLALGEHHVDYESVLEIARTLREQIDWQQVRDRTKDSPYAAAFFTLVAALGIVESPVKST
jgi:hypothetical protein